MRRWSTAFAAAFLASIPIFLARSSSPALLEDSDTKVLLAHVAERQAPFSWFLGDWPLFNHFYRPLPTLVFEMDRVLYGNNAAGFGLTNALLCMSCVLLLCWFFLELTENVLVAGAASALFAIWHVGSVPGLDLALDVLLIVTLVVGVIRHRKNVSRYLPACMVLLVIQREAVSMFAFGSRTVAWLPGRTALVMTVFALIASAAYARYERLGARRPAEPELTSTDLPATRTSRQVSTRKRNPFGWGVLAVIATLLALASYEQAVMVPGILLGTALTLRFRGLKVRWGWQIPLWLTLVAYVALRHAIIPSTVSSYQHQQFRTSFIGTFGAIMDYAFPMYSAIHTAPAWLEQGIALLFSDTPYRFVVALCAEVTTIVQCKRQWVLALAGWAMSVVAFLPMAWLKMFEHYHYWPLGLRTLLVVALGLVAAELCAIAWCRPVLRAPTRLSPAPGSLLRP